MTTFYLGNTMSTLLAIFNKLSANNIADYTQALYWYCTNNHEGQFTELYSILSTLKYKPALTEKAEDVDFDSLGFIVCHYNMLWLNTALRLWNVVQHHKYTFKTLHYFKDNLYLAEYRDYDDEDDYSTYYAVYSVDADGDIVNETFIETF